MRNPKNLIQILKYIGNQDQNHKAFSFLPTNETWENKGEANAVPQINETGLYKPKLLWMVPTSELLLSVCRDSEESENCFDMLYKGFSIQSLMSISQCTQLKR